MIYADTGINWFFPYEVEYEDDYICVLRELPRMHRFDTDRGADLHVDKWMTIIPRAGEIYVDGKRKLLEVKPG
jgi:hypothetical protein